MHVLIAFVAVIALAAVAKRKQLAPSAKLTGTSGGALPSPPEPQITPTSQLRTRNDFNASSYLGGFTGGNLSPISVEPVILDPTKQVLNTDLLDSHASALVNAPQLNYGITEPQSAAQTPENWSAQPYDPEAPPVVKILPATSTVSLQRPLLPGPARQITTPVSERISRGTFTLQTPPPSAQAPVPAVSSIPAPGRTIRPNESPVPVAFQVFAPERAPSTATLERSAL